MCISNITSDILNRVWGR